MKSKSKPLLVLEMIPYVNSVIDSLRKVNGCKYKGELQNVIGGCLLSNRSLFEKV